MHLIPKSKPTKKKKIIKKFNPIIYRNNGKHKVKSIELGDEFTLVEFQYRSSYKYLNGGWIQIHKDSFIRDCKTKSKYPLLLALNIPIAPEKFYFKRSGQLHRYTLVFPALPESTESIDIIEKEAPGTYFNFYNLNYQRWMKIDSESNYLNQNN